MFLTGAPFGGKMLCGVTPVFASAPYSPSQIPNLGLWANPSVVTSHADGDSLASVPDSSGTGQNITASGVSNQPTWYSGATDTSPSQPFLRFASNSTTQLDAGTVIKAMPLLVACAVRLRVNQISRIFVSSFDPDHNPHGMALGISDGSTNTVKFYTNGYDVGGGDNTLEPCSLTPGQWSRLIAVYDGTTKYVYLNGILQDTSVPGTIGYGTGTQTTLGYLPGYHIQYLDGDLGDAIIAQYAPSTGEIAQLDAWLAARYPHTSPDMGGGS